ncbi:sulfate transporter family protein [Rhizobiales bacterium]|uniref:sulfate transporter family protein n=1 Tax=Hongsoonwoonella zoysiae TaxID=2821844 RepID=UPI0015611BBB|nr:sulfate transporter family protein [Hongsoonwoonella zoysiae]NRG16563.1 sulfate transporter family protein [Hongsoonwoonella zoysiae]
MIAAAIRAMSQVFQPAFRAIFWKSLGFTLAALFLIWIALNGLVAGFVDLPYPWLDTALSILTGVGAFIGLGFLVAPVTAMFAAIFQDDIALIVEREDYPADGPGRAMPLPESIWLTVKFTGIVILANIFALMLLLVPGINLVAFFLVNGYLLGREFFEFAATRFMPQADAKALRRAHGATVFLAGLVIAGVLAVPILNLVTPIFATIFMVHLYKRLARGKAAAADAPPYRST